MKLLVLLFCVCAWSLGGWGQEQCPQFSGEVKRRIEQEARWLVSTSLQRKVGKKSAVFGALVRREQCNFLSGGLIQEGDFALEGFYFTVDDHALKSMVGRYRGKWMMALVPLAGKMPDANLLEISDREWTLIRRRRDGSRNQVASGKY
jgi:hypothetical protein